MITLCSQLGQMCWYTHAGFRRCKKCSISYVACIMVLLLLHYFVKVFEILKWLWLQGVTWSSVPPPVLFCLLEWSRWQDSHTEQNESRYDYMTRQMLICHDASGKLAWTNTVRTMLSQNDMFMKVYKVMFILMLPLMTVKRDVWSNANVVFLNFCCSCGSHKYATGSQEDANSHV